MNGEEDTGESVYTKKTFSLITIFNEEIFKFIKVMNFEDFEKNVIFEYWKTLIIKDINCKNFKSIKSYIEYLQNDVGLNIVSFIRKQINNQ